MPAQESLQQLCKTHLQQLFDAVNRGDMQNLRKVEHTLTRTEECVACTYAFKAKGEVRTELDQFLKHEGFQIDGPQPQTLFGEIWFWVIRLLIISALCMFFTIMAQETKALLLNLKTVQLGAIGISGVFMAAIASYLLVEQWFLE